jgi:hypothetical protein
MIRVYLLFVILTVLVYFGIQGIQKITGKQALALTRAGAYAIISSTLAMLLMLGLVYFF